MLQQTRVDAVLPYYERFLARWPDVESLARAPRDAVLHAWSGLGYYTRARNLHAAARRICEDHAGRFPESLPAIRALPGIGPYTAGAIASIAFGQPAAILDGNVVRVLSRLVALRDDVESAAARRMLWSLARQWAACRSPGDANQALMELGALVCIKPVPRCASCPLQDDCMAHRAGLERALPRPRRRPPPERAHLAALLLRRNARVLLVRRRSGRLLRDWWELPTCTCSPVQPALGSRDGPAEGALARALRRRLGLELRRPRRLAQVRHGILQHRLEVQVVSASTAAHAEAAPRTARGAAAGRKATPLANLDLETLEARWVTAAECRALALSTLTRKALRAASRRESTWAEYLDGEPSQHPGPERRRHPPQEDLL